MEKTSVPWAEICKVDNEGKGILKFISPECFPEGFQPSQFPGDPSHINKDLCLAYINHWKQRVEDGKEPVLWLEIPEFKRKARPSKKTSLPGDPEQAVSTAEPEGLPQSRPRKSLPQRSVISKAPAPKDPPSRPNAQTPVKKRPLPFSKQPYELPTYMQDDLEGLSPIHRGSSTSPSRLTRDQDIDMKDSNMPEEVWPDRLTERAELLQRFLLLFSEPNNS